MLPPGTGTGSGRRASAPRTELRAEIAAGRRGGAERRRAARRQAAGGAGGAARRARCRRRELAAAVGADRQIAAPARGARPDRHPQLAPCAGVPGRAGLGAAAAGAAAAAPSSSAAVDAIVAALDGEAGAPRELLLHGVTGSGKTEVYLAAVEAALARGRGAIVLVPEIGLAPQAVARFRARLGDRFAVLHSALSAGERYDEWRRLRSGEASVCVGPRSAVFAPVRDLGLIVIDEEHDPSYKQEGDPGLRRPRRRPPPAPRTAAPSSSPAPRRRARRAGWSCRGSSCRAGSTAAACRRSRWSTCARPTRARARCTPTTWEALEEVRAPRREGDRDGQPARLRALAHLPLLRPPLGLPQLRRLADRPPPQPAASSATTAPTPSRCPRACPECGSTTLSRAGAGTEQIEALLAERLDPMPVFRLDSDTAAGRGAHARILAALRRGRRARSWSAPRWSPRATTSPR